MTDSHRYGNLEDHRDLISKGIFEAAVLILRLSLPAVQQLATEKQPVINTPKLISKMQPVSTLLSWDGCKPSMVFLISESSVSTSDLTLTAVSTLGRVYI